MRLHRIEIPIAMSLLELARKSAQPFQEFICYWTAFNNIYAVIADRGGVRPRLRVGADGQPKIKEVEGLRMAKVDTPKERAQLDSVFCEFGNELKNSLIIHEATRYFVYRTPQLEGQSLERDALGQRLNGVLKVGRTANREYTS